MFSHFLYLYRFILFGYDMCTNQTVSEFPREMTCQVLFVDAQQTFTSLQFWQRKYVIANSRMFPTPDEDGAREFFILLFLFFVYHFFALSAVSICSFIYQYSYDDRGQARSVRSRHWRAWLIANLRGLLPPAFILPGNLLIWHPFSPTVSACFATQVAASCMFSSFPPP